MSTCDIKVKETSGGEQGHRVVAGAAGVTLVALAGLLLLQTRLAAVCPFWACFFPPPHHRHAQHQNVGPWLAEV